MPLAKILATCRKNVSNTGSRALCVALCGPSVLDSLALVEGGSAGGSRLPGTRLLYIVYCGAHPSPSQNDDQSFFFFQKSKLPQFTISRSLLNVLR